MSHAYTEDQLVGQLAIGLFAEFGRTAVSALEQFLGRSRGDETHLSPAESQDVEQPAIGLFAEFG